MASLELVMQSFRAIIVASEAGDHRPMSARAESFFAEMAARHGFAAEFSYGPDAVSEANLQRCDVLVMCHLAPFELSGEQQAAQQAYIERGGGWVGLHAAGLAGREFLAPGTAYWQWYEEFLGGVTYSPHPRYQVGTLRIEDRTHPATCNLPGEFEMACEWYEFNGNPRPGARVLAVADETTYKQNRSMGDHPMIWVNERYRRAIYIGLGHDPSAFESAPYCTLLRDSVLWAASA